ncbi:uncharacterized protein LOC128861039 [Anastrepha ludens]|uniref:uncharacterized protein LOC128861039 n=1 Tax=Anastrepha ludens TaxID=28586 RepID=UPI0023B0C624|nr:uncharacterized protein LOC128861039 [Anastrepha ludens]
MIKFTNLKCTTLDKPFVDFRYCKLKALARNNVSLSLRADLFQVPLTNVTVHMEFFKKYSGFRPFFLNITTNFCDFLRHKKRIKMLDFLFELLESYSNIIHSCPFAHDLIVDQMILSPKHFHLLPLPAGEYLLKIFVAAYNDWKAIVSLYVLVSE